MTIILQLIQSAGKTSTILEDAFLVVGALSAAIEIKFAPYIPAFLPFLYPALKAYDDTQLCTVAVGIIGDITRALGDQTEQYAQAFVTVLLENLSSEVLNRNVKISILACFGDIALAIGAKFEPYLETAMTVLRQAAALQANPVRDNSSRSCPYKFAENFGRFAHSWTMSLSITSQICARAFLRRTQASSQASRRPTGVCIGSFFLAWHLHTFVVQLLVLHAPAILELVQKVLTDDNNGEPLDKLAFGVVGDLADAFPSGELKPLLLAEWIGTSLVSRKGYDKETKTTVKWAREVRGSPLPCLARVLTCDYL